MELIIEEQPENFESILPASSPPPKVLTQAATSSFVRKPQAIRPSQPTQKQTTLSYDDILQKMGIYVQNDELYYVEKQQQKKAIPVPKSKSVAPRITTSVPTNSKTRHLPKLQKQQAAEQEKPRPKNLREYRQLLVQDFIQRERARRMKNTKLMIPGNVITHGRVNGGNMNKLFNWK